MTYSEKIRSEAWTWPTAVEENQCVPQTSLHHMQHEDQYGELAKAPAGNPVAKQKPWEGHGIRPACSSPETGTTKKIQLNLTGESEHRERKAQTSDPAKGWEKQTPHSKCKKQIFYWNSRKIHITMKVTVLPLLFDWN
jgi:hypothetical protein